MRPSVLALIAVASCSGSSVVYETVHDPAETGPDVTNVAEGGVVIDGGADTGTASDGDPSGVDAAADEGSADVVAVDAWDGGALPFGASCAAADGGALPCTGSVPWDGGSIPLSCADVGTNDAATPVCTIMCSWGWSSASPQWSVCASLVEAGSPDDGCTEFGAGWCRPQGH